jgi:hypothetical protein
MPPRRATLVLAIAIVTLLIEVFQATWRLPALAGAAGVSLGILAGRREARDDRRETGDGVDAPTERGAARAPLPARRYRLVAWDGERRIDHELSERHCVLGHDPGCDLRLYNAWAAPLHARITQAGDIVTITDLDSGSGTFLGLGGPRLPAHQPTEFREGDEIWIGPEVRVALWWADAP